MSLIPSPVRRGFEATLAPLVDRLIAANVNPNTITSIGTLVVLGSGVAFGLGWVRVGGVLLLLSGIGDMLDGRVARGGNAVSKFGAFYDSTLDRIGDAALFSGIAVYFVTGGVPDAWRITALVIALVALSSVLIISYARARAEGVGLECKVGIAQRAERILGIGIPSLFVGAGPQGFLLLGVVAVLALLAVITVVQRIVHVHRVTRQTRRSTRARMRVPPVDEISSTERIRK
ncbi:MAG: CDP-alcohol phosphatidyltransferase family protein [Gemmatimonadales bacterium]|jgi:CDP-diacylglycerol--glycerol-3-phosphate 3-phosphatidyltransferase